MHFMSSLLQKLIHFRVWPLDLLTPAQTQEARDLMALGSIQEKLPGWFSLPGAKVSILQLEHYRLTARFFHVLESAGWLHAYTGEQVLRSGRTWPFIPDGIAKIMDKDVQRELVVEIMVSSRRYDPQKVCYTLSTGRFPVFVVKTSSDRVLAGVEKRVGPLAAVISSGDLDSDLWQIKLRNLW